MAWFSCARSSNRYCTTRASSLRRPMSITSPSTYARLCGEVRTREGKCPTCHLKPLSAGCVVWPIYHPSLAEVRAAAGLTTYRR